jgi:hypothetical protein
MHTISIEQALSVWSDLERAYHGTNSYGGDEAEIYLYRFLPHLPSVKQNLIEESGILGDMTREAYDKANRALYSILDHFSKTREADILVNEQSLGPWLIDARYTHRVHIKVTPREK